LKARSWLGAFAVMSVCGCFYATLDTEGLEAKASGPAFSADAGTREPSTREPGEREPGAYTTSLDTPAIALASGGTTRDPCVQTTEQATAILSRNCSTCHAPPGNAGGFQAILNFPELVTRVSSTQRDPLTGEPVRLLLPGQPDRSRVYLRIQGGEMPPRPVDAAATPLPRPSLSDLSLLRTWIESCLPSAAAPPAAAGDAGPSVANP
jgi:hypothetical protein